MVEQEPLALASDFVGCALIIPMIIQTIRLIGLEPSRPTLSIRLVIGRSSVRIRPGLYNRRSERL